MEARENAHLIPSRIAIAIDKLREVWAASEAKKNDAIYDAIQTLAQLHASLSIEKSQEWENLKAFLQNNGDEPIEELNNSPKKKRAKRKSPVRRK